MANQKDKSLRMLEQRLLKRNTGMNFNQLSKTLDVEQQRLLGGDDLGQLLV